MPFPAELIRSNRLFQDRFRQTGFAVGGSWVHARTAPDGDPRGRSEMGRDTARYRETDNGILS